MDHLCPRCKTLLRITSTKNVVRDQKLFVVQELICVNPQCENKGNVVETIEHEQPVTFE